MRDGAPGKPTRTGPETAGCAWRGPAREPLRIRRSRLTHDLGQRRADRRVEAARIEAQLGTTLQLVRDAALDELDAEALLARGARGRAAPLLPLEHETLGVLLAIRIPAHLHVSAGVGERAVFRRIGRQLVKDHAEYDRGARGNEEIAARDQDRFLLPLVWLELRQQDLPQVRAGPDVLRQQVMGARQRAQPSFEGAIIFVERIRGLAGARGDRQHGCERVLDPMIELGEQHLLLLVGLFAPGDVALDHRRGEQLAGRVADRRRGVGDVDSASVLGDPPGLEGADRGRAPQPFEDLPQLVLVFGRHRQGKRPADRLLRGEAVDARGPGVPAGDAAVRLERDDGVGGIGDDRGQARQRLLVALALRYVQERDDYAVDHVGDGPVRQDAHDVAGTAVDRGYLMLDP